MNIPAVNFHLFKPCDAKCVFCFATFRDVKGQLTPPACVRLLERLRESGVQKLNFAGGEPTLHPHIGALIAESRGLGFTTSIVTNGSRLDRVLDDHAPNLDWVGLSVDSGNEATEMALGRSRGQHIARALALAHRCARLGIRVKLNSVICALNWQEDLSVLVRAMRPDRWKVFQVLPVEGQNDGNVEHLLISADQFRDFVARHDHLAGEGFAPIVEDNDAMRGSYAMIDPLGRFFSNATGRHVYSAPILDVGVDAAWRQIDVSLEKFHKRGGQYSW